MILLGGECYLLDEVKAIAPSNVKFLGWANPKIIWSASDIALLTSDNEAQPISSIEASYSSLPIVAENVGPVSEVVNDVLTEILVSNYKESEETLEELFENIELCLALGSAVRAYGKGRFSPTQFISGHEVAVGDVLVLVVAAPAAADTFLSHWTRRMCPTADCLLVTWTTAGLRMCCVSILNSLATFRS